MIRGRMGLEKNREECKKFGQAVQQMYYDKNTKAET